MAIRISRIEDATNDYFLLTPGSGQYGAVVYQESTLGRTVEKAIANLMSTSKVIGVITQVISATKVEIAMGGDVDCLVETGVSFSPGDDVFLSNLETGKVTNVPPTSGVVARLGNVSYTVSTSLVRVNFNVSEPIGL